MGLAFLRDSDDVRESPAIKVIDDLQEDFELIVHDPFVKNRYKVDLTRDLEAALREPAARALLVWPVVLGAPRLRESHPGGVPEPLLPTTMRRPFRADRRVCAFLSR